MQELCESLVKNPFIIRDAGSLFDEKTKARLERENEQTLRALKNRERIQKEEALKLQRRDERKNGKIETKGDETRLAEKSKEIQITKRNYRFTKWSKLKILRQKKQKKKWEEYLSRYRTYNFFAALCKLKVSLSHQEWHRTCHLKERKIIRKNIRLETILRLRWKYNINETIPADSIIFDKILKYEKERKKQLELRQERMIKIVKKIALEMNNGICILKKPKYSRLKEMELEEISEESTAEISFEEIQSEELIVVEEILKDVPVIQDTEVKSEVQKTKRTKDVTAKEGEDILEDKSILKKSIAITDSRSSVEQIFPKDNCFFAIPSVVTFEDFEVNKVYSRKVAIRNKTVKWAYLRFHKIYTEVWEAGVVKIDIMDAARVKPGLDVTVNVKFSPVHEEEVTAEISFLTLTPDNIESFHEFRVPVRCTPQSAIPIVEPAELRFPSAPIWKYVDPKYNERSLTISNDGKKPFSILIEERNDLDNYFLWHFDQGDIQSVKSSILCANENGDDEMNVEYREDASDEQKSRKMYQIEVPPKFKCRLRITFRPRYRGLHHENLKICFLSDNRILGKQSVPIWTEVIGYQIQLDPPCVDLGIVMIDSDVCQQSFNIINTGRSSVEVFMKTPKSLRNQVSVHPKSTSVQSESSFKVNVRLIPESSIVTISKRFYNPVSNMLEFPIQVQIITQDSERPPPLILKALASLTTCSGLVLEPALVDLKHVHTHESVYTELSLTNESLLIQEYAFINLPSSMEVQPNHGFGTILPGETIKLHLIYSACLTDIPGNEIRANGLTGERSFPVQVVTLAELAGGKKETILNKLKNQINTQPIIPGNRALPPPVSMNLEAAKTMHQMMDQNKDDFDNHTDSDSVTNEKHPCDKEEVLDISLEKPNDSNKRKERNLIEVSAYIIDTFCELSEQIIKFPATPCCSYSTASVHLRGFNMASYPHCTCGIIKNQRKEFTARYKFQSSSNNVVIIPQSGVLNSDEVIAITFILKPKLPKKVIFEEGLRLKMNVEEQEPKSEKDDKSTKKGKRKKKKQDQKKAVEVDTLAGEISLLESFEPCLSTISVTCIIDLETKNGTKHDELLFAKLICPITRPEIVILNEDRKIDFGATAVGTSSRKFLFVKNISTQSVKIDVSLLDPFGPFFVPPGKTIETGSILTLPVTYQPNKDREEKNREYFEVSSSRTRTKWTVKVTGQGVVPSYVLKPLFRVARFEVTDDTPAELKIFVQNTGSCPLNFHLSLVDELEGDIPRMQVEPPQKSPKKKKKGKIETSRKSIKAELDDKLLLNEELAIFGGNLKRSMDRSRFSFWNLDERMQLSVPQKKTVEFGVRFQLTSEKGPSNSKETTPRRKKKMEKKKKEDEKKSNYCHVAIVKLMLGSWSSHEFIMICSTN